MIEGYHDDPEFISVLFVAKRDCSAFGMKDEINCCRGQRRVTKVYINTHRMTGNKESLEELISLFVSGSMTPASLFGDDDERGVNSLSPEVTPFDPFHPTLFLSSHAILAIIRLIHVLSNDYLSWLVDDLMEVISDPLTWCLSKKMVDNIVCIAIHEASRLPWKCQSICKGNLTKGTFRRAFQ